VGRTLLESRQMPEGWWIVTVPFLRFWKRFAVVTPYGLERRRFLRLDSAEEFARQRHAAGETGAVALGRFASRPRPPRRVRSLGAWMVGTETDRSGSMVYVVASSEGVFMEEFDLLPAAEAYAQERRQADRARRAQRYKSRLRRLLPW
jgi:hypothetical protein